MSRTETAYVIQLLELVEQDELLKRLVTDRVGTLGIQRLSEARKSLADAWYQLRD